MDTASRVTSNIDDKIPTLAEALVVVDDGGVDGDDEGFSIPRLLSSLESSSSLPNPNDETALSSSFNTSWA